MERKCILKMFDFEGFKYVIINKASKGVVHLTDIAPTISETLIMKKPIIIAKGDNERKGEIGREFDFKLYEVVQNPEFKGEENGTD